MASQQRKRNFKKLILHAIVAISIIAVICVIFFFNFSLVKIEGVSMKPTLKSNEYGLIYKRDATYKRGDIISFSSPDVPNTEYIKRIIGLPGDKIEIIDGNLYLNGREQKEKYIRRSEALSKLNYSLEDSSGVKTVPQGKVFVLGDNRLHSRDSREFGFIDLSKITGKWIFHF
ncbi:signal peptidase I [Listeria aquatica]|uniref:signal peptidase I n=1 Tax=Listeria aquatica TaxID=1494960 RepID=UPI003F70116B